MIPWLPAPEPGSAGGGGSASATGGIMETIKPGEVILRKLFYEFTILADKKIDQVLNSEPLERPLVKSLSRGEDPIFDQLLTAFGAAAEHCLPSQLRVLFEWHDRQMTPTSRFSDDNLRLIKCATDSQGSGKSAPSLPRTINFPSSAVVSSSNSTTTTASSSTVTFNYIDQATEVELFHILEKRDLAIEFIFCLVLIEVLKQLPLHPGYEDLTAHIENLAFKHFKFREDVTNPNLYNINMIADLYAEVIGVLAQSRFQSVRKRFMNDFKELRAKEPSAFTTHSIISLLMGMKFFRVKMVPIEEFEASFQFMHECATYFLDVKDKDIKHALAGLFVEILVPVAATVKHEVNVPCLKNFVELLYSTVLDLSTKKKHSLALFPLVTCLLCVSQKSFFLSNWHYFVAMCLSHLKNRDTKMSRVALESLYRLLWVYMIRVKCESNASTQVRLHSIVSSLFPKGSKGVVPRDTPLNIFVKIIQFIAQERLDFAMKEIVFDLLSVGRPFKIIMTPERMSIGLRSFLVVADSLQQKDGEPPMPRSLGVLPSGNTLRVKKTFLSKMLTDEMAKNIGMNYYYPHVRKTLSDILHALDVQFGRPLMMTNLANLNKEPDDMITGERKPKIDLFRTCVAAIPRLIPDGHTKKELIDLLSRLTVHIDDEMCVLAFQSLQNLIVDFADWREDVIDGFAQFILYDIGDQFQPLIENALKMLYQLLTCWKNAIQQAIVKSAANKANSPADGVTSGATSGPGGLFSPGKLEQIGSVLYKVDALSLVMLCYCRQPTRKLAALILKESRIISNTVTASVMSSQATDGSIGSLPTTTTTTSRLYDEPVASVIDAICPHIIESCFPYITSNERAAIVSMSCQVDLQWLAERGGTSWVLFERVSDSNLSSNLTSTDSGRSSEARSDSRTGHSSVNSMSQSVTGVVPSGTSSGTVTSAMSVSMSSSMMGETSGEGAGSPADDELKLNAWSVALMAMMQEAVMRSCPKVTTICWQFVFHRLKSLFTHIDPNPVNDNRSLILRGSTSSSNLKRSISSFDRSFYIELWKNYLMMACSVAPSSIVQASPPTTNQQQSQPGSTSKYPAGASLAQENCTSPDSSLAEKVTQQTAGGNSGIEGNRSPVNLARGRTHPVQSLFKLIIEQMRCEQVDLRKAVILGLSQVNPNALADLLEELIPFFREAVDRKPNEKVRSRKRRELLRLQIGRLFKIISERKTFTACPVVLDRDESFSPVLVEYIDGMRLFLEFEADKLGESSHFMGVIKTSFCTFVCNLIRGYGIAQRTNKLSRELRQNLFGLFAGWSGKYGQMFLQGHNYSYPAHPLDFTGITELEHLAIRSMSTVLCSGSLFDQKNLLDGNSLYFWLTSLLNSKDRRMNEIGLESLILLLENNLDAGPLLEWLVECCYTKSAKIADACFTALATIFSIREYPCDRYIAIIIVTIVNVACPRIDIQQLALQLLQILDARFFTGSASYRSTTTNEGGGGRSGTAMDSSPRLKVEEVFGKNQERGFTAAGGSQTNTRAHAHPSALEPLLLNLYPCTQANIAKRMAALHPQLTMIVFSEITFRLQTARPTVCQNLLNFLLPWLYNMQLVDPTAALTATLTERDLPHTSGANHHLSDALEDPETPGGGGVYSRNQFEDPMAHSYGSAYHREGWGSVESTEMVLNNLFYITIKFGDDYAPELEKVWSSLCGCRPNNLAIIIRYLFILTGLSPNELLPYAKRIAIYLARAQPEHLIDLLMTELQAVEFLNFNAERTEAFPYFRIVNRKCSASHLLDDEPANQQSSRRNDATVAAASRDAGTLHTKRHSKDLHGKYLDQVFPGGLEMGLPGQTTSTATTTGFNSSATSSEECNLFADMNLSADDSSLPLSERGGKAPTPQPRPLPMPEYGGYYAPLNDFLTTPNGFTVTSFIPLTGTGPFGSANPGASMGGFHRCNLALMLLTDIITQEVTVVDWSPHIPLMLHILFLGMDHSKAIVYEHCKALLLNLLIVTTKHRDNLNVSRILLNNLIIRQNYGLAMPFTFPYTQLSVGSGSEEADGAGEDVLVDHGTATASGPGGKAGPGASSAGDLDLNRIFTKSTENVVSGLSPPVSGAPNHQHQHANQQNQQQWIDPSDIQLNMSTSTYNSGSTELNAPSTPVNGEKAAPKNANLLQHDERAKFSLDLYIKTLIDFISSKTGAPLWNYEDITAKVWAIRSAEQMECFVEHVLFVFKESIPYAKIQNRWAEIALQLALSCSSRHYAGRSLQIFRALKIPINSRMLSDILSRLVETISEQGEDMQGYVTELMLTLESAIDSFDFKPRNILELINEYFHFDGVDMEEVEEEEGDETDEQREVEANEEAELLADTELDLPLPGTGSSTSASTPKKDSQLLGDEQQSAEATSTTPGGASSETADTSLHSTSSSSTLVTGSAGITASQSHTESFTNSGSSKLSLKMPLRSTSYSMSFPTRKFNFLDDGRQSGAAGGPRFRTTTDADQFFSGKGASSGAGQSKMNGMGRSQSVQSLMKNAIADFGEPEMPSQDAAYQFDDKTSILAQFFWIAVILLETDYEHEFALALRLLEKVQEKMALEEPEVQEKIEKIFIHFKWHHFPGVHALLLKGLASPVNYEQTIGLLHKLTPLLAISVIDPAKSETAFPFHVMAMLPYMLHNYEDPNELCTEAAKCFAKWCNENSSKLENLATVMTLYSKRCFSKENSQWIKCVVKYLYDAYPNSFVSIVAFLVEVAEKGPPVFLNHILSILHFMLNYIDLSTARLINGDILRVANKYIEGPQWKEALKIIKLAVSRSSSLAAPSYPSSANYPSSIISNIVSCGTYSDCISIASSSFAESEFNSVKQRELPGRTMDFLIDLSQTPVVGFKFIQKRAQLYSTTSTATAGAGGLEGQETITSVDGAQESLGGDGAPVGGEKKVNSSGGDSRIPLEKLFEVKESIAIPDGHANSNENATNALTNAPNSLSFNNPNNQNTLNKQARAVSAQIRIRERLIGLLNRCGQRIGGLPKSPSVIFSQNSDIIECHKSSMASSVEDISATNNDVSGDSKHDDTAHGGEFAFFKEFDFLEYELESQEGESLDNFNWGVRRKSLSNLDNSQMEHERINLEAAGGGAVGGLCGANSYSTGTLKPSKGDADRSGGQSGAGDGQRTSIVVSGLAPQHLLKIHQKVDDFSSDDEVESVSPLYEGHQGGGSAAAGGHHAVVPGTPSSGQHHRRVHSHSSGEAGQHSASGLSHHHHERTGSRPASLISHGSSHSLGSDTDGQFTVTTLTGPSLGVIDTTLPEAEPISEEAVEQWSSHFVQLINDNTGTTSAMSNQILALIFRKTFSRVIELTRECCELVPASSSDPRTQSVSGKFLDLLDIVSSPVDFPYVFIDPKLFITVPKLLERHRFAILELHAHWETFNEKRDSLVGVIGRCARMVRETGEGPVVDQPQLGRLCKMMYKMHFQLFLLFECYLKFVELLKSITTQTEVQNYSSEMSHIKTELVKCLATVVDELATGSSESGSEFSSLPIEGSSLTKENELELKELIQAGHFARAVKLVHVFKENIPDLFSDDCIEAMLTIYCRSIFDNQSSYLVVTEHNLSTITRQLRETSYEINNLSLC